MISMYRRITLVTLQYSHRKTSTLTASAYSVDDCPFRSFAKKHPEAARLVLEPPPPSSTLSVSLNLNSNAYEGELLTKYLQWRGWDVNIKQVLNEHKLGDDLVQSAVGLVSHLLTFPLTLGRHVKHFKQQPNDSKEERSCKICCVGARSECTLPDDYWKEFLFMTSIAESVQVNLDRENKLIMDADKSTTPFKWFIDFVGPDVPTQLRTKTILLGEGDHPKQTLTMNYHTSFLHDLVLQQLKELHTEATNNKASSKADRLNTIRQHWDGYVLFNPGLGHPNLSKQWESTIKFLFKTNKPVLITAHSALDALRDLEVLRNKGVEASFIGIGNIVYKVNPYASRMEFIDPFAKCTKGVHTIRPNHSVILLNRPI